MRKEQAQRILALIAVAYYKNDLPKQVVTPEGRSYYTHNNRYVRGKRVGYLDDELQIIDARLDFNPIHIRVAGEKQLEVSPSGSGGQATDRRNSHRYQYQISGEKITLIDKSSGHNLVFQVY